jgi:hypothetical protein
LKPLSDRPQTRNIHIGKVRKEKAKKNPEEKHPDREHLQSCGSSVHICCDDKSPRKPRERIRGLEGRG